MLEVSWSQVLAWRMKQQSLLPRTSLPVADVVRRCAGIQAQVHSAAVLAVAQRSRSPKR
jgi:uncharacterized protein YfaQ (DUF2300 family)